MPSAALLSLPHLNSLDALLQVSSVWGDVWNELGTSETTVLTQHGAAVLAPLEAALKSDSWPRRAAAASVLSKAAKANGSVLQPHAQRLMRQLLDQLPGRIWAGKEAVIEALGSLATNCAKAFTSDAAQGRGISDGDVIDALVVAAARKEGDFADAAASALVVVLTGFQSRDHLQRVLPVLQLARVGTDAGASSQTSGTHPRSQLPWLCLQHCSKI